MFCYLKWEEGGGWIMVNCLPCEIRINISTGLIINGVWGVRYVVWGMWYVVWGVSYAVCDKICCHSEHSEESV